MTRLPALAAALLLASGAAAQTPMGAFASDLGFVRDVLQLDDERILISVDGGIVAYAPDGTPLGTFASDLGYAGALAQTDDGRVLVATASSVETFAASGERLETFAKEIPHPTAIEMLQDGRVLVARRGDADEVRAYSASGVPLGVFADGFNEYAYSGPWGLIQLDDGRIVVTLENSETTYVYTPDGQRSERDLDGLFEGGGDLTRLPDGSLLVIDASPFTYEIDLFDSDLSHVGTWAFDEYISTPDRITAMADGRVLTVEYGRVQVYGGPPKTPEAQPFLAADLFTEGSSGAVPRFVLGDEVFVEVGDLHATPGAPAGWRAVDAATGAARNAPELDGLRDLFVWRTRSVGQTVVFAACRPEACSADGPSLYALDVGADDLRRISLPDGVRKPHPLTVDRDRLLFGALDASGDPGLYVVEPAGDTVTLVASLASTDATRLYRGVALGSDVYVAADAPSHSGSVYRIDTATGSASPILSNTFAKDLTAFDGRLYVSTLRGGDGEWAVYDPASGAVDVIPHPAPDRARSIHSVNEIDGRLYLTYSHTPKVFVFDAASQTVRLSDTLSDAHPSSTLGEVTPAGGLLFFTASVDFERELYVYDPATETIRLAADLSPDGNGDPIGFVASSDALYLGAMGTPGDRELYAFPFVTTSSETSPEAASVRVGPNPFRARTAWSFGLDAPATIRLTVTDVLGREVAALLDGPLAAGEHRAEWDAADAAPGVYLWRLSADGQAVESGRVTRVR